MEFDRPLLLRCILAGGLIASAIVAVSATAATQTQRVDVAPGRAMQSVNLRDRLVVGLQARLKSEVDFVEAVAARVRTGQLPRRLVDETFLWARQRTGAGRPRQSTRPIIYFQPAMSARAKRLGVTL